MSCFLVEPKTIKMIAEALLQSGIVYPGLENRLVFKEGVENLCLKLYKLNAEAVVRKYKDKSLLWYSETKLKEEIKSDDTYKPSFYSLDLKSYLKLHNRINCFLYQCTEFDIPKKEIYKKVVKLKNLVNDQIAEKLQRQLRINPLEDWR